MDETKKSHSPVTITMHAGTLFENPRQPHLAHNSVYIPCSWCLAHLTYMVIFPKLQNEEMYRPEIQWSQHR